MLRDPARPDRDGVGYLRLAGFQPETPHELDAAIARLRIEGMRALVIDLRGNAGGSFLAAVRVAETFLNRGVVVMTRGRTGGTTATFPVHGDRPADDLPLVVLIDADTASAAEVVAAAWKEARRAKLIGQPTYGKGSVQATVTLAAGGALRLTLARLFTGRGRPLDEGVVPHVHEPDRERQLDLALDLAGRLAGK